MRILPFALLAFVTTISSQAAVCAQSPSKLYDIDTLRSFYLTFPSTNWYSQLQSARSSGSNVKGKLAVDATGKLNVKITIPNTNNLKGTTLYMQTGVSAAGTWRVSNGLELRICN